MNAARLLEMATFLESDAIKPHLFNQTHWRQPVEGKCGTAACAVGNAAVHRVFDGLTLERDGSYHWGPVYEGIKGWEAVQRLFDLRDDEAQDLFGGDDRVTKEQVAKAIRDFLKAEGGR